MKKLTIAVLFCAAGCTTGTTPLTEPIFAQSFTISNDASSVLCSGSFTRSANETEITAPIACQDGRTGNAAIRTQPNGHPMVATASLVDGSTAHAIFLPIMSDRHAYAKSSDLAAPSPSYLARSRRNGAAVSIATSMPKQWYRRYIRGPRGGCYYINSNGNKTYVDRGMCN